MKRTIIYGLCLFFAVLLFASRGLHWSTFLHPDEVPVAKWIGDVTKQGFISDRLYPSGWFELARLKVAWDKSAKDLQEEHRKWTHQDMGINALKSDSFRRMESTDGKNIPNMIVGREFNVFLTALSALVVYLACLQIGLHPLAAAFAGLLMGCNPFIMEHSHYCETDLGLVFSFALSLWLLAACSRRRRPFLYFLFAVASGFAVSCKYTLSPALVPVVALPFVWREDGKPFRWRVVAPLLLLGLAGFCAGFALGTPALYKMPGYVAKVRDALATGSGSATAAWGREAFLPYFAKLQIKAGRLCFEMRKLGWPTLAFFMLSIVFCSWRRFRKLPVDIPAILGVFLLFYLFYMPWIRNQETLPLLLLLALAAARPVDWAIGALRRRPLGKSAIPSVAILALAATVLSVTIRDGLRMTSFFLLRETRAECQNWLAASMPQGQSIAADSYLTSIRHGTKLNFILAPRLDQNYPESLIKTTFATNNVRYYLRNTSHFGRRSNRSPFSRKLLPATQSRVDAFCRDGTRLMSWHVTDGRFRPAFAQPDVELWRLPDPANLPASTYDIPVWFPRPTLFRVAGATLYCNDRQGPIGPDEAVQTVGRRRFIRFPKAERQWAVVRMAEGNTPATIAWSKFAAPRKAALEAGGADVFEIGPRAIQSAMRLSAMPGTRVRMKGDDQNTLVLTSCLDNPTDAANLLRTCGEAEKALALLEKEPELSAAGQVEAFRAARALGQDPRPEWRAAAQTAVDAFDQAFPDAGVPATNSVTVCGVPLEALRDCARIRLAKEAVVPGRQLPVFLPKGRYGVRVRLYGVGADEAGVLFNAQSAPFEKVQLENGDILFSGELSLERGTRLAFAENLPEKAMVHFGWVCLELEITWDPVALVRDEIADIRSHLP